MYRKPVAFLDVDDEFPSLDFATVGGTRMRVPDDLAGKWAAVLFYRGSWCGFCRQQLLNYEVHAELFKQMDIQIVAVSVDSLEKTLETVGKLGLTYPMGYGLDAKFISTQTGIYVAENPTYFQPAGFLLRPNGRILNAVYSSRSIGRLVAQDVASLVSIVRSREGK